MAMFLKDSLALVKILWDHLHYMNNSDKAPSLTLDFIFKKQGETESEVTA